MSKCSLSVMSKRAMSVVAMAMGAIVLDDQNAFAKTVAVGPATCQPSFQHYPTIQAAVTALASTPANNTVLVCPGTYPEQITITQPTTTIKGVVNGNDGLVLITVPPTGLVANVVSPGVGLIAAQVGASNTFGTQLINLTIDGTGISCAGAARTAGIAFANIGDITYDTFAGTIQNVVVRNQYGCETSDGIVADNSFITVTGNVVHDIAANGINQIGGNSNINNNTLQICNVSGIVLSGVTGATVTANILSNNQYGIRLDSPNNVTVANNTIGPWMGTAIYVVNGLNTGITGNKIKSSWAGIWLTGSTGAIVRTNNVSRTQIFAFGHTYSGGGNTFTNNTISEGRFGLYAYNPVAVTVADAMVPNTFLNIKQVNTADPWVPE
jgi:parallel beta-helix repeat protein